MKITAFNTMIASKEAEQVIKVFEALGFTKAHQKDDVDGKGITDVRMKDENGFCIDISSAGKMLPEPHDMTVIRMNVDDFDEAYNLLINHGFKDLLDGRRIDGGTSEDAVLFSPTGFGIRLIQHKG